jgi:hypothetical protein
MNEELKTLEKEFKEIRDSLGISAFERLSDYYFTLWRKIEDLLSSRTRWRERAVKAELTLKELKRGENK